MMDASSTQGQRFVLAERRSKLFGLVDLPPRLIGGSLRAVHIDNRTPWPRGKVGRQVSWSHHGMVRVVELEDGRQLAVWCDETQVFVADGPTTIPYEYLETLPVNGSVT